MLTALTLIATSVVTRFGEISVFAHGDVVRVAGFGSPEHIAARHEHALEGATWERGELPQLVEALQAWENGDLHALDDVAVAQPGGPFMQRAWQELRDIPAGEAISYAALAERAGSPRAARAAGQACARNAIAPFVPCHRVVPSTGVGNYGYGPDLKRDILAHEGVSKDRLR